MIGAFFVPVGMYSPCCLRANHACWCTALNPLLLMGLGRSVQLESVLDKTSYACYIYIAQLSVSVLILGRAISVIVAPILRNKHDDGWKKSTLLRRGVLRLLRRGIGIFDWNVAVFGENRQLLLKERTIQIARVAQLDRAAAF